MLGFSTDALEVQIGPKVRKADQFDGIGEA